MSIESLSHTIVPKSDQLNADDLIASPITVSISSIKETGSKEQPIAIDLEGRDRPWKPCLTMRRVMIGIWGDDGRNWIGRSVTLFRDPTVTFGIEDVGGIRISHMSNIGDKPVRQMVTTKRGKRKEYIVCPLVSPNGFPSADWIAEIESAADMESLAETFKKAVAAAKKANADSTAIVAAKDKRKSELEGAA